MPKNKRETTLENHNTNGAYAQELADTLAGEHLSVIDFDRLQQWLLDVTPVLKEIDRCRADVALLRQDYIGRIAGMAKAIAAVNRHPDGWERALAYCETLPSLSTGELIEQYRKTSARFRDAFPTSFGLLGNRKRGVGDRKDVSAFK
jgi:hypothetical protein